MSVPEVLGEPIPLQLRATEAAGQIPIFGYLDPFLTLPWVGRGVHGHEQTTFRQLEPWVPAALLLLRTQLLKVVGQVVTAEAQPMVAVAVAEVPLALVAPHQPVLLHLAERPSQ